MRLFAMRSCIAAGGHRLLRSLVAAAPAGETRPPTTHKHLQIVIIMIIMITIIINSRVFAKTAKLQKQVDNGQTGRFLKF